MVSSSPHICMIAGEASGDFLGASLMAALRERFPGAVFSGIGGALMTEEGLISLFSITDLSVMGVAEVVPRLPLLMHRISQTAHHIKNNKPDIVITIDSPDFCFRVAKKIQEPRPLMIHYVAPTVWAWRPERAKKVASLYDGLLCLFPFEPAYFEKEGMEAEFTGHPVMETKAGQGNGKAFRERHGISSKSPTLGLFFGSRIGELNRMGPVLREAAVRLAKTYPDLHLIVPTLPHLKREARNFLRELPCGWTLISDAHEKWDSFAAMDCALATSGTVGLELAVAGVPHAIGYRISALTYYMIRKKITTRFAHLANILLDQAIVPEFLQQACEPQILCDSARQILEDPGVREDQRRAFGRVRSLLGSAGESGSSGRAADFICQLYTQGDTTEFLPGRVVAAKA